MCLWHRKEFCIHNFKGCYSEALRLLFTADSCSRQTLSTTVRGVKKALTVSFISTFLLPYRKLSDPNKLRHSFQTAVLQQCVCLCPNMQPVNLFGGLTSGPHVFQVQQMKPLYVTSQFSLCCYFHTVHCDDGEDAQNYYTTKQNGKPTKDRNVPPHKQKDTNKEHDNCYEAE